MELNFKYCESEDKSECIHCNKKYKGKNWSNLKRHILKKHPYHASDTNVKTSQKRVAAQDSFENEIPIKKQKKLEPSEFIQSCVELATINLVPFNFFNFDATKKLFLFHQQSTGVTINYNNIRKYVHLSSQEIKSFIKQELQERMIALKIDTATRLGRSILGVNVQFYSYSLNTIVVRTIGIIEIRKKHTAQNISLMLSSILDEYGIDKRFVSSITCDNGANIVASAKMFQDRQNSLLLNDEIQEYRESLLCSDEDDEDETEFFDEHGPFDIPWNITEALKEVTSLTVLLRCSIHTLQLGVHDALKEIKKDHGDQLSDIRKVVKNLKSSTYTDKIKSLNIKIPGIDVCTRWNSSFVMIHKLNNLEQDLMKLYEFYSGHELDAIKLNSSHWNFIKKFYPAFLPCYDLTMKLQKIDVGMGNSF